MPSSSNRLIYVISTETLKGQIDGEHFEMQAVSGGGRGSTRSGVPQFSMASYDPRKPTTGSDADQRGGAIPPGLWWVYPPAWTDNKHPHLGVWVSYVEPTGNQAEQFPRRTYDEASGFFIHGAGKRGSNGCLVIAPQPRRRLLAAIEDVYWVALEVVLSEHRYSPQDLLRYIAREGWREA